MSENEQDILEWFQEAQGFNFIECLNREDVFAHVI
jgi:cold shock CspA family protein